MYKDNLSSINQIIDDINQETGNKIEISKEPSQSHAKFLTMDDNSSIITSFNLFAFAGNGLADDEITDELGVVINSKVATKVILESFPKPIQLPKPVKKPKSNKRRNVKKNKS